MVDSVSEINKTKENNEIKGNFSTVNGVNQRVMSRLDGDDDILKKLEVDLDQGRNILMGDDIRAGFLSCLELNFGLNYLKSRVNEIGMPDIVDTIIGKAETVITQYMSRVGININDVNSIKNDTLKNKVYMLESLGEINDGILKNYNVINLGLSGLSIQLDRNINLLSNEEVSINSRVKSCKDLYASLGVLRKVVNERGLSDSIVKDSIEPVEKQIAYFVSKGGNVDFNEKCGGLVDKMTKQ